MTKGYRRTNPNKRRWEVYQKRVRYNVASAYGDVMEKRIAERIQDPPPLQAPEEGEGNGSGSSD